jgi:hypothetical protein
VRETLESIDTFTCSLGRYAITRVSDLLSDKMSIIQFLSACLREDIVKRCFYSAKQRGNSALSHSMNDVEALKVDDEASTSQYRVYSDIGIPSFKLDAK